MITALLIESWDIYSMAFILFALKDIYEPSSWLLGFTAAGTQLGAVVGALLGGWLTDKLGRRKIFLWSMILFAIFAVLQGLAPNMYWLAIIRCLAGIPVGADVANGFTYIMEVMPKGKREVMANRWQFMFALGIIAAILLVTTLVALDVHPDMIWRIVLAVPAIPACLLLFMRRVGDGDVFVGQNIVQQTAILFAVIVTGGLFRFDKAAAFDEPRRRLRQLPTHKQQQAGRDRRDPGGRGRG